MSGLVVLALSLRHSSIADKIGRSWKIIAERLFHEPSHKASAMQWRALLW